MESLNLLKNEYDNLSKRINEFIQWAETDLNDFFRTTNTGNR